MTHKTGERAYWTNVDDRLVSLSRRGNAERVLLLGRGGEERIHPVNEREYRPHRGYRNYDGIYGWSGELRDSPEDVARKKRVADAVRDWAKYPFIVMDSETTGLEEDAELVSIGIVDHTGKVLLDTLIKPIYRIPHEATEIHGIRNSDVADAPTFEDVYPLIRSAMQAKRWAGYNIDFDTNRLDYQVWKRGLEPIKPASSWQESRYGIQHWEDSLDAMEHYAEWWGDYHEYYGNYRWQKLSVARKRHRLHKGRDHGALDDAITTLRLIEFLGGYDG